MRTVLARLQIYKNYATFLKCNIDGTLCSLIILLFQDSRMYHLLTVFQSSDLCSSVLQCNYALQRTAVYAEQKSLVV